MSTHDPIDLLFGGLEKLGPGDDAETLHVLRLLPRRTFRTVVDVGCGNGRQTIALARELGGVVDAVDNRRAFLDELVRRAGEAKVGALVRTHEIDMAEIPTVFRDVDLLWCEGAAYNIGFGRALATWAPALAPDGFLVASELSWTRPEAPRDVREYFRACYPGMKSVRENLAVAEGAGYRVLFTHTLPRAAWVTGYYAELAPRATALLEDEGASVRAFAAETLEEIAIFERSDDSYGYVFYALQRA